MKTKHSFLMFTFFSVYYSLLKLNYSYGMCGEKTMSELPSQSCSIYSTLLKSDHHFPYETKHHN